MLSWNFYFRRNKKYIPTFPDTKKIQTMDCSILFVSVRPLQNTEVIRIIVLTTVLQVYSPWE